MSEQSAEAMWDVLEKLMCQVRELTHALREHTEALDANTAAIVNEKPKKGAAK